MPTLTDHLAALEAELQAAQQALDAANIPPGLLSERVTALVRENAALQSLLIETTHTLASVRETAATWQRRALRAEEQLRRG